MASGSKDQLDMVDIFHFMVLVFHVMVALYKMAGMVSALSNFSSLKEDRLQAKAIPL